MIPKHNPLVFEEQNSQERQVLTVFFLSLYSPLYPNWFYTSMDNAVTFFSG